MGRRKKRGLITSISPLFLVLLVASVEQDLDSAFCGIRQDRLELAFFRGVHAGRFRNISGEMDRVKFASCRAQTAADASVRVNDCGSALQTSVGFRLDLFFGQRQAQILECLRSVTRLHARNLAFGIVITFD